MGRFYRHVLSYRGRQEGWKLCCIAITSLMLFVFACNLSLPNARVITPTPSPTPTSTEPILPSPSPSPPPAARLSARAIAQQAVTRISEVKSFHFSIQPTGRKPDIAALLNAPLPVLLSGIEGDIVRPEQLRARITVTLLGASAHLDLVHYQDQLYLNNPLTGRWEKFPQEVSQSFSPAVWFSDAQGLSGLFTALDWRMIGVEEVQGVSTYHLQARNVPGINITGSDEASEASIDVWIGEQTFLLHQVRIDEQAAKGEQKTVWLLSFSAFDRPVVITPPPVRE